MKCYAHPEKETTASCKACSKGLCLSCTDKYTFPSCDACALDHAKERQKIIIKNIVLTIVFGGIGFWLISLDVKAPVLNKILVTYMLASLPWGWSALDRITPNIFLFMPLGSWVFYFMVKATLSMFVGLVALPLKIVTTLIEWRRVKKLKMTAVSTD
jgi:hypothetical protein